MGFFGLAPKDKPQIHESIFTLCHYGNGFNFSEVYEMPTYLRNWYLQKLADVREAELNAQKKAMKKGTQIHRPSFEKSR